MVYTYNKLFVSYKYPSTELPTEIFTSFEKANEFAEILNENLRRFTDDTPIYKAMSLYHVVEIIKEIVEEDAEDMINNWGDDPN